MKIERKYYEFIYSKMKIDSPSNYMLNENVYFSRVLAGNSGELCSSITCKYFNKSWLF